MLNDQQHTNNESNLNLKRADRKELREALDEFSNEQQVSSPSS